VKYPKTLFYLLLVFCVLNTQLGNFGFGGAGIKFSDLFSVSKSYADSSNAKSLQVVQKAPPTPTPIEVKETPAEDKAPPASKSADLGSVAEVKKGSDTATEKDSKEDSDAKAAKEKEKASNLKKAKEAMKEASEAKKAKPQLASGIAKSKGFKMTESYISLLVMIVMAVVAAGQINACDGVNADLIMAAVAGLTFISSQIVVIMDFSKQKFKTVNYQVGADGYHTPIQIKAVEDQIDLFEKVIKAAELKKMLQLAAASIFFIAVAWGLTRHLVWYFQIKGCGTVLDAGCGACPDECSLCTTCKLNCATAERLRLHIFRLYYHFMPSKEKWSISAPSVKNFKINMGTGCTACALPPTAPASIMCMNTLVDMLQTYEKCTPKAGKPGATFLPPIIKENLELVAQASTVKKDPYQKIIETLPNMLFPKAHGFMKQITSGLGLAGIAAALFYVWWVEEGNIFDFWMSTPWVRAIAYGVLALLAGGAAALTSLTIGEFQGYVKKLKNIRSRMQTAAEGVALEQHKVTSEKRSRVESTYGRKKISGATFGKNKDGSKRKMSCLKEDNEGGGCPSVKDILDESVSDSTSKASLINPDTGRPYVQSFASHLNQDATLSDDAEKVGEVGDGLQGRSGISEGTLGKLDQLAKKHAFYKRKVENIRGASKG